MPLFFWHHALSIATYLLNILPSKVLNYLSPTQLLYQSNPLYSDLLIFGCLCFPLFPSTTIHKLQERSTPCVYLGPAPNHRGSKCYEISSGGIIICRHVRFVENEFPFSKIHKTKLSDYDCFSDHLNPAILHFLHPNHAPLVNEPNPLLFTPHIQTGPETFAGSFREPSSTAPSQSSSPPSPLGRLSGSQQPNNLPTPLASPGIPSSVKSPPSSLPSSPTTVSQTSPRPIYPMSHRITTRFINGIFKPNPKYFSNLHTATTTSISPLPKNPVSALRDQNWKNAMLNEFNALIDNKTWELVPRPPNVNVIRSMWIFRHKHNADGSFERYKARLVGNGTNNNRVLIVMRRLAPWLNQPLFAQFSALLFLNLGPFIKWMSRMLSYMVISMKQCICINQWVSITQRIQIIFAS